MDGINRDMNYKSFEKSTAETYYKNWRESWNNQIAAKELRKIFDNYANSDGDARTLNPEEQDRAFAELEQKLWDLKNSGRKKPEMGLVQQRQYCENDSIEQITVQGGEIKGRVKIFYRKVSGFQFKYAPSKDGKYYPQFDRAHASGDFNRYNKVFNSLPKGLDRSYFEET